MVEVGLILRDFFCLWIVCHYAEAAVYSVVRCAIWYQSLFGVCMVVRTYANVCCRFFLPSCHFYLFAWVPMAFEWVYQLSNACMPFKRVNISNLMTFNFFSFTRNQNILPRSKPYNITNKNQYQQYVTSSKSICS